MSYERLLELLENKEFFTIKDELELLNPSDLAEYVDQLDTKNTLVVFRLLSKEKAALVFAEFSKATQNEIAAGITEGELSTVMEDLYFDDMIDVLEDLPSNLVKRLIDKATPDKRKLINQFLGYPEDSAGSIMTIEFVKLRKKMTVREALAHIKEIGLDRETVYTNYITDASNHLEGIISLRKLVIADGDELLEEIMDTDIVYIHTDDDQEEVASIFKKYGFLALPVVDSEQRLTGIITVDDILEIIQEENTEDFELMAAISPTEDQYLALSPFKHAAKRLPWLMILMISATVTGNIIQNYEDALAKVTILTSFIPMLMDTGGNTGSQSSTLVIRGLALGELDFKDFFKVVWMEFKTSIIVAIALALVNYARLLLFTSVSGPIALTVSLSLIITVVSAKLIGAILPLIAVKLKADPAIMAGPLITTIVDATSLIGYFYLATRLLNL